MSYPCCVRYCENCSQPICKCNCEWSKAQRIREQHQRDIDRAVLFLSQHGYTITKQETT